MDKNLIQKGEDFRTYSGIDTKEIQWLWQPYIVKGNLNIIVGDGGVGKSYLTTWLSSAISRGEKIPFSNNNFEVGDVILQNAEDDVSTTTLPSLLANNAMEYEEDSFRKVLENTYDNLMNRGRNE